MDAASSLTDETRLSLDDLADSAWPAVSVRDVAISLISFSMPSRPRTWVAAPSATSSTLRAIPATDTDIWSARLRSVAESSARAP